MLADLHSALAEQDSLKGFSPRLSWTHYRTLCRVEERAERLFDEIEAERNGWSQPELERQIHGYLYAPAEKLGQGRCHGAGHPGAGS